MYACIDAKQFHLHVFSPSLSSPGPLFSFPSFLSAFQLSIFLATTSSLK